MKNWMQVLRKPKEVDEVALAALRERGAHAERLIRDETLAEAFVRVEQIYLQLWRGSAARDVELREHAHMAVSLLADLKNQLLHFVREGESAVKRLEAEARKRAA